MSNAGLGYVRKKDFQIVFDLGLDDLQASGELSNAVRVVRTSRLNNTLLIEFAYPVDGLVHQTIEYLCFNGIISASYDTLEPGRRVGDKTPGHISYFYEDGAVIDQYAVSSREDFDQDDPMLDVVQIQFLRKTIKSRKWVASAEKTQHVCLVEQPKVVPIRSSLLGPAGQTAH